MHRRSTTSKLTIVSLALLITLFAGCKAAPKVSEESVARVAKDWCMTIRGSQVLPVYPLTEDILPGDVFLVDRPIQEEQAEYKERGFLKLPQHFVRLHPSGINRFYLDSHGTLGKTNPPYFWRFDGATPNTNMLYQMPRAAFPTYQFSSRRGGGLNVAVPISAIPVAVNLVGASEVNGSVFLKDAYTYGFDQINIQNTLLDWTRDNSNVLKELASPDRTNVLRVVSRIFLVGAVSVQVQSAASFSGAASGGAEKQVNLPNLSGTNTVQNYTNGLAALSSALSSAVSAPGGTLKVSSASSRSVSLDETFPRPLVIGYHGFDVAILPNGQVSLPQDTLQRIKGAQLPPGTLKYGADQNTPVLRAWLRAKPENRVSADQWLRSRAPTNTPNLANVITAEEHRELRADLVAELVR